jgi:sarcosine oxidase, subunit beta
VATDFLTAARDAGVDHFSRTQATGIAISGGNVCGVVTNRATISAPIAMGAIDPWTKPLFDQIGCTLPIECEFHQVAILRNSKEMKGSGGACIDSVTATYFRADAHHKFLVGDFYGKRPADPDNFPQSAFDESLEQMIERACRRIPNLSRAEVTRRVTGVYDMTPDSRPLLGEIPEIRGLYICVGFSGMGFKISPAIGLVMSELVLDGEGKAVDISAFRPQRFADGKSVRAEHEYVND